jgi:phenylacetyl-CoA:acceptor oxidoreductase subunit 2
MSASTGYGPAPAPQTFWDGRAAANFTCGGLGAGLVIAAALSGATGLALAVPLGLGLAIIACGLAAVFAELGRPWRAAGVVRNPMHSWMTREALLAPLLVAAGLGAMAGYVPAAVAAVLALAFVFCQGRMLRAARGIPAWRAPAIPWLFVATGLAEGLGLWLVVAAFQMQRSSTVAGVLAVAAVARLVAFSHYRRDLDGLAVAAARALDRAGRVLLHGGTLGVLALLVAAAAAPDGWAPAVLACAGLLALLAGLATKLAILRRAAYTQGFTLPALPVRGTRA